MDTDKRKHARLKIDIAVKIEMADGTRVHGRLADISQGGACLKIDNTQNLPDQFLLKLPAKLDRWCRLAWRADGEAGVEFVDRPNLGTGDKVKHFVLIQCPRTGRDVPTGVQLATADDLKRVSVGRRFSHCPYCNIAHGWTPAEAFLR
jgi:hypothetical protein